MQGIQCIQDIQSIQNTQDIQENQGIQCIHGIQSTWMPLNTLSSLLHKSLIFRYYLFLIELKKNIFKKYLQHAEK
jgi:hypothetical protein